MPAGRSFFLLLIFSFLVRGAEDPLQNPGFVHFYNNEYDQALAIFQKQAESHPDRAEFQNDIAQTILFREMFRNGSLESQLVTGANSFLRRPKMAVSPQNKELFAKATDRALSLGESRLKQDNNDVNALFDIAVAHGLRANFDFLVEKAWMQALHEAVAARKANERILQIAPNAIDAQLLHGASEYVVGCMPAYLRMLGAVNGFHADKEDGIHQLRMVVRSGARNRYDAAILLAVIYRREHRPREALQLVSMLASKFPRNYLFRFEQVQMYSDLGDKQAALTELAAIETAIRDRQPGFTTVPLERVQYARGSLLFWYGDPRGALDNLLPATRGCDKFDLGTAGLAWLRLGQDYDLLKQYGPARSAYQQAVATVPHSDISAEAEGYMRKPYRGKSK